MKMNIFIVFHNNFYWDFFTKDLLFTKDYYTLFKADDNHPLKVDGDTMPLVVCSDLPNYTNLGKSYCETQAIYNIYKNPELYADLDYIGFTHYDKPNKLKDKEVYNITELIVNSVDENSHVSFETYPFEVDQAQQIMMDINQVNILSGNGKSAYEAIVEDYNLFHGTEYSVNDLRGKKVNLVSAYLLPVPKFINIMKFIAHIVEIKDFTPFTARWNMPGGFLERYTAVALAFENLDLIDITTEHYDLKKENLI